MIKLSKPQFFSDTDAPQVIEVVIVARVTPVCAINWSAACAKLSLNACLSLPQGWVSTIYRVRHLTCTGRLFVTILHRTRLV